jgi:hypothetical protein
MKYLNCLVENLRDSLTSLEYSSECRGSTIDHLILLYSILNDQDLRSLLSFCAVQ